MKSLRLGLLVALLSLAGSAWADGAVVRWNAIVGVQGSEGDSVNMAVANFTPAANWTWVDSGFVTLNLNTGQFKIVMRYVSWAANNPAASEPIGSVLGGANFARRGRFVCDAIGHFGDTQVVETDVFYLDKSGSASVQGSVDLPQICRDHPEQMAFLVGGANSDRYFAYGVGKMVLAAE